MLNLGTPTLTDLGISCEQIGYSMLPCDVMTKIELQDYKGAMETLEALDEAKKMEVPILKLRAFLHIHLGNFREAWVDLNIVHGLAPDDHYISVYRKFCFMETIVPKYLRQTAVKVN